jgi:NADH-quinone oxidoreductase subunit E
VDAMLNELRGQIHRPILSWEENDLPNSLKNN